MYKALITSANSYRDSQIASLPNTLRDAQEICNILTSTPSLFEQKEVQFFSGNQVRTNTLSTVIGDFFINVDSDDVLFFFWAGHGCLVNDNGFLITFDTNAKDIKNTAIDMNTLRSAIDKCNARAIFIWLDCCNSGAIARSLGNFQEWMKRGIEVHGIGKIIIAACNETQSAYENISNQHGEFTLHLLNGLRGKAANEKGEIDALNLYNYISNEMTKTGRPQTPVLKCTLEGRILLHVTKGRAENVSTVQHDYFIQVSDSGNWCLLSDYSFQFENIDLTIKQIAIKIVSPPKETEINLQQLMKKLNEPYWNQRLKTFCVFGNSLYNVELVGIKQTINNSITSFDILLDIITTSDNSLFEMSVVISGGLTVSADEIAEMRARRILLGEKRHTDYSRSEWNNLEMFISQSSNSVEKITESPIPTLLQKYIRQDKGKWECIRLELIKLLIDSNCVKNIIYLILNIVGDKIDNVSFKGIRNKQYENVPSTIIHINAKYIENSLEK